MTSMPIAPKNAVCSTCTLKLVSIAYRRAPLFRLLREPLKGGMRAMAWLYRVHTEEYVVRTPACYGCIRFYKLALKERSAIFRAINSLINPIYDRLLLRIITRQELEEAQAYARQATAGDVEPGTATSWMDGLKVGF